MKWNENEMSRNYTFLIKTKQHILLRIKNEKRQIASFNKLMVFFISKEALKQIPKMIWLYKKFL